MTLSDLSIKNPVFAWMLMIALIVFGWVGFSKMGISQLPDVDFPVISVNVTLEGAAPEVMETEVTDVIEDAVMSVQGVREVSSTSRQGSANISVEFELNRDIDVALQEIQSKIAQAQRNLPREIDPPVVTKSNPEDQPIMWVALYGDRRGLPLKDLMAYTKDFLKNQFTTVSGVGDITLGGYIEPNLRVWVDNEALQSRELTVTDLMQAIESEHRETPAGYIDTGKKELNVRVMGEADTVELFSKIVVPRRGGSPVWTTIRLGDVSQVEDSLNDIRRISRFKGIPSVGLGIKKQRGTNAVAVARAVKAKVQELQSSLPQGMHLEPVFDTTKFIEESTEELIFTLILSALLTSLVCWLFLGSWSSTVNVLLAIPTSILGAFIFLYFFGFTLNTFTLVGLSLAIGIVVDDAIMVLENIVRYREQGTSRVKAAIVGARQISFAAMAASVAILAIFVPVIFMKGIMGKFFFQFGITMSVAVLLSLLEALTIAPMRCSQFLEVKHTSQIAKKVDDLMESAKNFYRRILEACLRNRWGVIGSSFAIFAVSLALAGMIRKEFVPPQDEGRFLVRMQIPIGSSIQVTDEVTRKAEEFMSRRGEVNNYYAAIGGFGGGEVNAAMMFVTLKPPKERPIDPQAKKRLSQQDFMQAVRKAFNQIPGIERAVVQDLSLSGFSAQRGFPVEFSIRGPDWTKLASLSEQLMQRMKQTDLMVDVDSNYQEGMPEVRILPNREQAAARGVSISTIADTINAMIGGVRVGKYTKEGKRYDIRVRLVEQGRLKPQDIQNIQVRNDHGEMIPLSAVVTMVEKPSLQSISRRNRERSISVFANVTPGQSQAKALETVQAMSKDILPDGYRMVLSGSAKTFQESMGSLMMALVLGIFVAYMVLGSQFNSFVHPLTVLLALPFSVTGAFVALVLGGQSLNIYSMIGIILLMGIVKKNAILLVDFTNERRRRGLSLHDALLEACPIRLRPILMTSFATIAGAIPPALGIGPGAETRIPMALVVIGGVFVSTFLTLLVVPCAYSLFARFESQRHEEALKEALVELKEVPQS